MEHKRLLLIINPVSGKKAILRYLPQVIRTFMDAGCLVTTMVTARKGEATEFAACHAREYDQLVCCGGDGTLNEVLSGLVAEDIHIPVGYIPCGSTNDFAVSRGLSSDILSAAEAAASGQLKRYDVGRFGDFCFSYVAAFGAFSWLSYTTDQNMKNVLGHTAYLLDAVKDLSKVKPWHLKLSADGSVIEGDFLFGAICNSTSIAGTLALPAEQVDTCDGIFEVLLIREPKTLPDLEETIRGLLSQNYDVPNLEFFHASRIHIEAPADLEWTVDGEFADCHEQIDAEPLPGFLELRS